MLNLKDNSALVQLGLDCFFPQSFLSVKMTLFSKVISQQIKLKYSVVLFISEGKLMHRMDGWIGVVSLVIFLCWQSGRSEPEVKALHLLVALYSSPDQWA